MKKTINYIVILLAIFILSCQDYSNKGEGKNPNNNSISSSHLGA